MKFFGSSKLSDKNGSRHAAARSSNSNAEKSKSNVAKRNEKHRRNLPDVVRKRSVYDGKPMKSENAKRKRNDPNLKHSGATRSDSGERSSDRSAFRLFFKPRNHSMPAATMNTLQSKSRRHL